MHILFVLFTSTYANCPIEFKLGAMIHETYIHTLITKGGNSMLKLPNQIINSKANDFSYFITFYHLI